MCLWSLGSEPAGSPEPELYAVHRIGSKGFLYKRGSGWSDRGSGLIFIASPHNGQSAAAPIYLTTYANPVGNIPGNYVEADGNPTYESGFNYTVSGLTVGDTYTLSFYQGASQQTGFTGTTTNQWIVALTTVASGGLKICGDCGPVDPVYGPDEHLFQHRPQREHCGLPTHDGAHGNRCGLAVCICRLEG